MKTKSKQNIKDWHISNQIKYRPTKTAKGITYTNERRAKQRGNFSFLYSVILTKLTVSRECQRLSTRGTLDSLSYTNKIKKHKMKLWQKTYKAKKAP